MTEVRTQRCSGLGELDVASARSTMDLVAPVLCTPERLGAKLLRHTQLLPVQGRGSGMQLIARDGSQIEQAAWAGR